MRKKSFIAMAAFCAFSLVACSGARVTTRAVGPLPSVPSVSSSSCNIVFDCHENGLELSDANVLTQSLAFHLNQSNLFKNVGAMQKDADATLTATVVSASRPAVSFGSFPVSLKIKYVLTGTNLKWETTVDTATDSGVGCTTILWGVDRIPLDIMIAYSKNFSQAVNELSKYLATVKK